MKLDAPEWLLYMLDTHEHSTVALTIEIPCQRLEFRASFSGFPELSGVSYSSFTLDGVVELDMKGVVLCSQKTLYASEYGLAFVQDGGNDAMLRLLKSFNVSSKGKAHGLEPQTDAKNRNKLLFLKTPELFHQTNVFFAFRPAGPGPSNHTIEALEVIRKG